MEWENSVACRISKTKNKLFLYSTIQRIQIRYDWQSQFLIFLNKLIATSAFCVMSFKEKIEKNIIYTLKIK